MANILQNILLEKEILNIDVDSPERLSAHKAILSRKSILKNVFHHFHHQMMNLDEMFFKKTEGIRLELGAGVCPIKESYTEVLATDIVFSKDLDRVVDAQKMDIPSNSVRTVYGQNCFHHFPDPDLFFGELDRVLTPGGGAILLEPYFGFFATILFKRLFKTEGFDKSYPLWQSPSEGPMNGANQALSYIVFVRDRANFENKYPNLRVVHQELCQNHFKYLLSGGLNFKQLMPDWMEPLISLIQKVLSPFDKSLSLHHIVVIRKSIK